MNEIMNEELVVKVLNGEELTTEEMVDATNLVLSAVQGDEEHKKDIYNVLSRAEHAIVMPTVFSAVEEGAVIEQHYSLFTENFETALAKSNEIMYHYSSNDENETEVTSTGVQAYIVATNIEPSRYPTVSVSVLAEALLGYEFDYKTAELTDIIENGYCLTDIMENRCMYLMQVE